MAVTDAQNPLLGENTCGSLLNKLQEIWDEVGESDEERDMMLLQIEQECLEVYKRKVEDAAESRAQLLQSLSDAKIELCNLLSALGERSFAGMPEKTSGTIKEQLAAIAPILEQLRKKKDERVKEFSEVISQIQNICGEIAADVNSSDQTEPSAVDESDLSLKKFDEYQSQLHELQKEKSERLHKVLEFVSTVHDLCSVLGMDFFSTVIEVHPSLDDTTDVHSKSISNGTLARLANKVLKLKEDKQQRLHKLQELASQLIGLWNLMDTSLEERSLFDHVTCNMSSSVDEVTVPGALDLDLIDEAEVEVERLDQLKASRMKEIALKKQAELEEIFTRAHIAIYPEAAREKIMSLIDSGNIEPAELLGDMDNQIAKAKEEALSRKDILDKVEKWMSACEEESWLDDYNQDDNRYNASRAAHLNLKRAEKARILVNKIPALVDTLVSKTCAWEEVHNMSFTYDGIPLLAMLDEYAMLRHGREEEKRRMRVRHDDCHPIARCPSHLIKVKANAIAQSRMLIVPSLSLGTMASRPVEASLCPIALWSYCTTSLDTSWPRPSSIAPSQKLGAMASHTAEAVIAPCGSPSSIHRAPHFIHHALFVAWHDGKPSPCPLIVALQSSIVLSL